MSSTHPGGRAIPGGDGAEVGWTVVLPLKGGPAAKSRLGAPAGLATAIALDCLDAVLGTTTVTAAVVVTPDPVLAAAASQAGAGVRAESTPGGGLGAAVDDGLRGLTGPCAVLLGDLPSLQAHDLAAALSRAAAELGPGGPPMVFVPDAEGTGTVLLAAWSTAALRPRFGPGSADAHELAGARRLELDLPRLRRDVDTPADLDTAVALGVGPRTRAALPSSAAPGRSWLNIRA